MENIDKTNRNLKETQINRHERDKWKHIEHIRSQSYKISINII